MVENLVLWFRDKGSIGCKLTLLGINNILISLVLSASTDTSMDVYIQTRH